MKLSRKEELLISIGHDFEFLLNDLDELIVESDPLERLAFTFMKSSLESNLEDYKKVFTAIHQTQNRDLSND